MGDDLSNNLIAEIYNNQLMIAQPQNKQRFSEVKNGPIHPYKRECTDILCCIIFVVLVGVMIGFGIYGYSNGDTTNIYRGTGSTGTANSNQQCGGSVNETKTFPYMYLNNPIDITGPFGRFCVKNCPTFNPNGTLQPLDCYGVGGLAGSGGPCAYTIQVDQQGNIARAPTANDVVGYDSYLAADRVCIPKAYVMNNAYAPYVNNYNNFLRQAGLANLMIDIQNNWRWLILALIVAIVISIIFVLLLKCCACCFIWLGMFLILLVIVGAGFVFLINGGAINMTTFKGNFGINVPDLPPFSYYNAFGAVCFVAAAVIILVIICCFGRIKLAVALAEVAGEFVTNTCTVFFVPLIMTFVLAVFWVFAIFGMITIISTATFVVRSGDIFTSIEDFAAKPLAFFYFFLFGTFWVNAMLLSIPIFVVASACAVWYFSKSPAMKDMDSPISSGFWMAFRYHFGTLSFGSIIIAFTMFIQWIFQILSRPLDCGEGCCACLCNLCNCCVECVRRVVEFMNKHAYIQCAITGYNYCTSAADSLSLTMANPQRFGIVTIVGWLLAMVGRILITSLTSLLFYLFISYVQSVQENIQEPIYLVIIVALFTFAVATMFMAMFDVAVDTLLQCFLIDEQANVKPQYAHPDLVTVMKQA